MTGFPVFAMLTPPPGGQSSMGTIIFLGQIALIFGIFWFLLIRPQRQQAKQHADMLKALKKGDEVVTAGGIVGEVVHIKDDRVTVRSGESKLVVERERITKVVTVKAEGAAAT